VKTPSWDEILEFLKLDRWTEDRSTGHDFFEKVSRPHAGPARSRSPSTYRWTRSGPISAPASTRPGDAITAAVDAIDAWINTALALGRAVPPPSRRVEEHSGRFVLRVPRGLHGRLAREAEREGVSLNTYCATVLAGAVGASSEAGSRPHLAIARISSETR
jgi:HicB family